MTLATAEESSTTELAALDAVAQADLVRRGEISPLELVDAAIARIESLNPGLNAVIHERFERAREDTWSGRLPAGPFRGVPVVLKDLVSPSAGDPFHSGMRFLRGLAWTGTEDSFVAARLRAAGFVFVGRTNTPELGLMPTTEPAAYGPTRNPWDLARSPLGSSGGSAAAVASGMVPLAHATDGGGSIRLPASACGLVGLKASRDRILSGPSRPPAMGLAIEGALTRSVRDAAAILDVLAGGAPGALPSLPRPLTEEVGAETGQLRVGVLTTVPGWDLQPHADCAAAARDAAGTLESLGHVVEEEHPDAMAEGGHLVHFGTVTCCEAAASLDEIARAAGRPIGPGDVEPGTWALAEAGRACSAVQLLDACAWLHDYALRMAAWWERFDLLLTPTIAEPPPPLGAFASPLDNPLLGAVRAAALAPFTAPFNTTGQPAISLPLGRSVEGLPVGVQLVAAVGREDLLIRVAAQLEEAMPWAGRRPPVSA